MTRLLRRSAVLLATTVSVLVSLLAMTASTASAAWSTWASIGDRASILACKSPVDSPVYGPLWKVTLVVATTPDYSGAANFLVVRNGNVVSAIHLEASNGSWDVQSTYASRYWGDEYRTSYGLGQISTGYGLGEGLTGPQSISRIADC